MSASSGMKSSLRLLGGGPHRQQYMGCTRDTMSETHANPYCIMNYTAGYHTVIYITRIITGKRHISCGALHLLGGHGWELHVQTASQTRFSSGVGLPCFPPGVFLPVKSSWVYSDGKRLQRNCRICVAISENDTFRL